MDKNYHLSAKQLNNISELGSKVCAIGEFLNNTTPDEFGSNGEFYWNVGEMLRDTGSQISEIAEGGFKNRI